MRCGKPVRSFQQEYCRDCEHTHHYYDQGAALWLHKDPVSQSVYRFKFHNQRHFVKYYAKEMSQHLGEIVSRWNVDLLIPVPLYPWKMRKRGYNQAGLLARELGNIWKIDVDENVVFRIRNTKPQKKLDPTKRKQNLNTAFKVRKTKKTESLSGKRVMIIDDIYTTGSTVDAVAKVLKASEVEKVYYLPISIGQGY